MSDHPEEAPPSTISLAAKNFVLLMLMAGIALGATIYAGHTIANKVLAAHAADHGGEGEH